ncbi:esterase/lipase family protein [Nocardia pseudobrasiliensis]|uniref:Triacylglycerol esterase/lipase EstA (Alpha/beta hydrolase family) n=1 Tax=Nocardia pseudobrasiliensis TaxID=45979 RepID=A0A370IEH8_9NOCA|nr:alpha/beta fold hydrolase [Nocardia pseudobrasiliensis]RDI69103.1 triacylglycerol esterase/lipase EstA (alpha/beta hydrolase family) [Nocardia pseudobrasiliensis]
MMRWGCAVAAVAALVSLGSLSGAAAAESEMSSHSSDTVGYGPVLPNGSVAWVTYGMLTSTDLAPQGSNDWDCKPSEAHPRPIILLHGSWNSALGSYSRLSPQLAQAGYCVFALNYGRPDVSGAGLVQPWIGAVGPIEQSARQLARFVERVRTATGAEQVDMIGHSQGGLVIRQYLKDEGGADPNDPAANKVRKVITFGATNHGTTLLGLGSLALAIQQNLGSGFLPLIEEFIGPAGIEQLPGSPFLTRLNADGDTVPGIEYTVISTRYDEVTTPNYSTFLTAGPGATVHNVLLQDGCPIETSTHNGVPYSPRATSIVLQALDPSSVAELACTPNL